MFQAEQLPARVAKLDARLAEVDADRRSVRGLVVFVVDTDDVDGHGALGRRP